MRFLAPATAVALGLCLLAPLSSQAAPKPVRPRGVDARTGRATLPFSALVKANRKNDRAALERLAARFGVARLAEGARSTDASVAEASLATIPYARGGVLLAGAVADRLDVPEVAVATAAARTLGVLLDADAPTELADWEVPPDVVARACAGLRWLANHVAAPAASRLAALDALAAAQVTCPATADLAPLLHDPTPAVRRATALVVLRLDLPQAEPPVRAALRDGIADPDPVVSAASVAAVCRRAPPSARSRLAPPDELLAQATGAARVLVVVPATPPEDAVEMLTCVAAAGTPADRALLERLRAAAPSAVRDRAAVLLAAAGKPE